MAVIFYKEGYRYQLEKEYIVQLKHVRTSEYVTSGWWSLTADGVLTIPSGYAWDGASGPAMDTKNAMRGSLIHDVCYQMIRLGALPESARRYADEEYRDACLEDGMSSFRAWIHFRALRRFGGGAAKPASERPVLTAP